VDNWVTDVVLLMAAVFIFIVLPVLGYVYDRQERQNKKEEK
jgi:hypothetical protein